MENAHPSPADRRESSGERAYFVPPRSLAYLPRVAAILSFGIALTCLTSWLGDHPLVGPMMTPLTSIGVMLVSASVWFSCFPAGSKTLWFGRFFAFLVVLLGLCTLAHLPFSF